MTPPHSALPFVALAVLAVLVSVLTRRSGPGAYTFGQSDTTHDFQGRVFRMVSIGLAGYLLARLIWPGIADLTGTVAWLATASAAWAGLAAIVLGGTIVLVGQWQMGRSWRIGLGREPTELVTSGLFSRSRNPIFLGFLLVLIGGFLSAANAVTAATLAVGWVTMATQIRLEEADQRASHGTTYEAYCARVRRWL